MDTGETGNSVGGDGEAQGFMRRPTSPPSPIRRIGGTTNSKSGATAAAFGSGMDVGVSSASASSFASLGSITHAVVLRLRGGFPRVIVMADAPREEEQARRPAGQGEEP